jgi:hypothetical protein
VDPALIKIYAMNKPDCIKLMDVDMEILELALLDQVGVAQVDGMDFMREGLVGLPPVRPASVLVPVAPQILPVVPLPQPMVPAGIPMPPVAMGAPVYNIAAGANVTINIINGPAPL